MLLRSTLISMIALISFLACGCSESVGPVSLAVHAEPTVETQRISCQSQFLGTWNKGSKTLTIRPMGQDRFRLHTEASFGEWSGLGHERNGELIAIFWMEWNLSPDQEDRHWFVTYSIDANDVLHFSVRKPDGSPGQTGTLARVK